jgi:hypothetical protein
VAGPLDILIEADSEQGDEAGVGDDADHDVVKVSEHFELGLEEESFFPGFWANFVIFDRVTVTLFLGGGVIGHFCCFDRFLFSFRFVEFSLLLLFHYLPVHVTCTVNNLVLHFLGSLFQLFYLLDKLSLRKSHL